MAYWHAFRFVRIIDTSIYRSLPRHISNLAVRILVRHSQNRLSGGTTLTFAPTFDGPNSTAVQQANMSKSNLTAVSPLSADTSSRSFVNQTLLACINATIIAQLPTFEVNHAGHEAKQGNRFQLSCWASSRPLSIDDIIVLCFPMVEGEEREEEVEGREVGSRREGDRLRELGTLVCSRCILSFWPVAV
jgi:hypothetical protein